MQEELSELRIQTLENFAEDIAFQMTVLEFMDRACEDNPELAGTMISALEKLRFTREFKRYLVGFSQPESDLVIKVFDKKLGKIGRRLAAYHNDLEWHGD